MAVAAYSDLVTITDAPFHIGITEAGSLFSGTVKSAIGLGNLLWAGLGDTIRVSLSADPVEEVKAAADLGETTDPYRPIIVKFIEPIKPGLDREKFEEKLEIAIEGETKTLIDRSN